MKLTCRFWFTFLALAFIASPFCNAQNSSTLFADGKKLFAQGNYLEAKQKFDQILKYNPRHPARAYSFKAKQAIQRGTGGSNGLETQISKIIVPSVTFEEVALGDALNYVRQRSQELTNGKVVANIIFQGTQQQKEASISLRLSNVPMTTLLKYIATQAQCKVKYEKYAVSVTPFSSLQ